MEKFRAMLIPNTEADLTVENFYDHQDEVHNPMVIILDSSVASTPKVIKHFHIAANTMDQLNKMFKYKYFETQDIEEGKHQKIAGAYFVGVGVKKGIAAVC